MFKALLFISFGLLPARVLSQTPAPTASQPLPSQSTSIKDVPVPIPSEVFATLDKFAHSNWRAVQRPELGGWKPHGDQAEIALRLGAVIAEGFVAVEAEDAAEVKNLGQAVLVLARALGVERAALRRSRSIVEHAEKGDWLVVRKEWDDVQPDVERGMKELKSDQLAQLVSLGGWLRGTQALTALVTRLLRRKCGPFASARAPGSFREGTDNDAGRPKTCQDARRYSRGSDVARSRWCANSKRNGWGRSPALPKSC